MLRNELNISPKDWISIVIIGVLFGFFQSLIFYFLNQNLQNLSTITFFEFVLSFLKKERELTPSFKRAVIFLPSLFLY